MNTTGTANEAHALHLAHLKQCGSTSRAREYIEEVRRTEGQFAAKWLSDEFWAWFQRRKQKEGA